MRPVRALLGCLLLLSCAVADMPLPEAALPIVRWSPPEAPRAAILALHGFNDRKAAFDEFGAFAAAHGVLVEAYDQRGFGARPDRGRWAGVDVLVAEARGQAAALRAAHPGIPVYVMGESMGAAVVAAAFAGEGAPEVDGLILSAPAVWGGKALQPFYRRTLTIAAFLIPWAKFTGKGLKIQASDNIEALRELGRDPLYIAATRVDSIAGLVKTMDRAREVSPAITLPMLILTGGRDQVVPPQAQAEFIRSLRPEGCTAVTYLNGWHLLLRDLQRQRVFDDILAWVGHEPLPSDLGRACGGPEPAAEVGSS